MPERAARGVAARPAPAAIRAERAQKPSHDPFMPIGHRWDIERGVRVEGREVLTVFLTGAECPFTCLFCDLWQHTLEGPTPAGALPVQLATALEACGSIPPDAAIKLYNASNFFDRRAVPTADLGRLAAACAPFARVTVESHPRLLGDPCEAFSDAIAGRLEIAMGLETIHPVAFPRLKDGMSIGEFDDAVGWAVARDIGVRVFVLVGLPWVPAAEYAEWAVRSAAHAFRSGADRVSLIPLRSGGGALARLRRAGDLEPVTLAHVETALSTALARMTPGDGIVEADVWDAEAFACCPSGAARGTARLLRMNATQRPIPAEPCPCEAA